VETQNSAHRRSRAASKTRGRFRPVWDLVFGFVRFIARRVQNAQAVFGIFLMSGALIAVAFTWAFTELAGHVRSGKTQAIDDAIMRWVATHQYPGLERTMLEVTSLGTGLVVGVLVLVAGMFLWLNSHKHSAVLLVAATLGGIVLNNLLKLGFSRPRPQVFEWGTHAASFSFPSGHAMSSVIVYSVVAYLAARLQQRAASRVLTLLLAAGVILAISVSRVYLGVHYPSDILAGMLIGLAWAGFCMAVLEAAQLYARRNAPQMLAQERPAPHHAPHQSARRAPPPAA
jgi:undecaprenyl-diphosphatase